MNLQYELAWIDGIREFTNKVGTRFVKVQDIILNTSEVLSANISPARGEAAFYHIVLTLKDRSQFSVAYQRREEAVSALDQFFKDLK